MTADQGPKKIVAYLITAIIAQWKMVLEEIETLRNHVFQGYISYSSENDRFLNSEKLRLTTIPLPDQGLFLPGLFFPAGP